MEQVTNAVVQSLAQGPVELDVGQWGLVSGGLPKGTWSELSALPKGTWSEAQALPKGTWEA